MCVAPKAQDHNPAGTSWPQPSCAEQVPPRAGWLSHWDHVPVHIADPGAGQAWRQADAPAVIPSAAAPWGATSRSQCENEKFIYSENQQRLTTKGFFTFLSLA